MTLALSERLDARLRQSRDEVAELVVDQVAESAEEGRDDRVGEALTNTEGLR